VRNCDHKPLFESLLVLDARDTGGLGLASSDTRGRSSLNASASCRDTSLGRVASPGRPCDGTCCALLLTAESGGETEGEPEWIEANEWSNEGSREERSSEASREAVLREGSRKGLPDPNEAAPSSEGPREEVGERPA